MKIIELTIDNIGQFSGRHVFELDTSCADSTARNLVIFQGHNGAGKSTIFSAIQLALHGRQALPGRVTDVQYNEYLLSRLHHRSQGGETATANAASATITFTRIESGTSRRVTAYRSWIRRGATVEEAFQIACDGSRLKLEAADAQDWLNERFSPGVAAICFFDAERLDAATNAGHQQYLAETLRRLLGLDLVERLQADLDTYNLRKGGIARVDNLRNEMRTCSDRLNEIEIECTRVAQTTAVLQEKEDTLLAALEVAERALVADGGTYAVRRAQWASELSDVVHEKDVLQADLRDMCSGLMPFALAPAICGSLKNTLVMESNQVRKRSAASILLQLKREIVTDLESGAIWRGLCVAPEQRLQIASRIGAALDRHGIEVGNTEDPLVHDLKEQDLEVVCGWISEARYNVPIQVVGLGDRIRQLSARQAALEESLKSAPTEDAVAPHLVTIESIHADIASVRRDASKLAEERGALHFRRDEQRRALQAVSAQLDSAQLVERQMVLAVKSKLALRTYQEALTKQRVRGLEQRLVENFNAICSKKQLLPASYIDPDDFSVHLRGLDGSPIMLGDFSAGERQLYTYALLQAFRQVCNQDLPLLIDTPLARLDDAHRTSVAKTYFPEASSQVLLFATDAELPPELAAELAPETARYYSIRYDHATQQSAVVGNSYEGKLIA